MKYKNTTLYYVYANYAIALMLMLFPIVIWSLLLTILFRFSLAYEMFRLITLLTKVFLFISVLATNTIIRFTLSKDLESIHLYYHKPKTTEWINRGIVKLPLAILLMLDQPIIWILYGCIELVHIGIDQQHRCILRHLIEKIRSIYHVRKEKKLLVKTS